MSEEKALTLKQEKFCHYYVDTDGNASEAYRMAYDAAKMKAESIWVKIITHFTTLLKNFSY